MRTRMHAWVHACEAFVQARQLSPLRAQLQHHTHARPQHTLAQEESFHLVDNRPVKKPTFGQRRFQPRGGRGGRGGDGAYGRGGGMDGRGRGRDMQRRPPWQSYGRDQQRVRVGRWGQASAGACVHARVHSSCAWAQATGQ